MIDSMGLSKIIAPNLCWLRDGVVSTTIYDIVKLMIDEYEKIFLDVKKWLLEKETELVKRDQEEEAKYVEEREKLKNDLFEQD